MGNRAASGQAYIPEGEEPHSLQTGQKLTRAQTGEGHRTGWEHTLPRFQRGDPGTVCGVQLRGTCWEQTVRLQAAGFLGAHRGLKGRRQASCPAGRGSGQVAWICLQGETMGTRTGGSRLGPGG